MRRRSAARASLGRTAERSTAMRRWAATWCARGRCSGCAALQSVVQRVGWTIHAHVCHYRCPSQVPGCLCYPMHQASRLAPWPHAPRSPWHAPRFKCPCTRPSSQAPHSAASDTPAPAPFPPTRAAQLRQTPAFRDADIIRSRDPAVLATADVVIDVGGVYEPEGQVRAQAQRRWLLYARQATRQRAGRAAGRGRRGRRPLSGASRGAVWAPPRHWVPPPAAPTAASTAALPCRARPFNAAV